MPEPDLARALYRLNLFFADDCLWFQTSAKKEYVDLFDEPIPIGTTYYKRSIGPGRRSLMVLSPRSLARVYQCLSAGNAKFEVLVEILNEEEHLLMERGLHGPPAEER